MTHEELYTEVVNAVGLNTCIQYLPATREQIAEALKTDEYLNNIPLKKWDERHEIFKSELRRVGAELRKLGFSSIPMSMTVCTLKRASKMWVERDEK